jgi:hypothetical protein
MTRRILHFFGLYVVLVIILAVLLYGGTPVAVRRVREGGIVGPSTAVGPDGLIDVLIEEYVMARVIASEAGGRPRDEKIAKGWVLRNDARKLGWSIVRTATFRSSPTARGKLGQQAAGGGRYATSKDPRTDDLEVARLVLSGAVADPTSGATKFFDARTGQKGALSLAAVTERWGAEGYVRYQVPGVSTYFFAKARGTVS